MAQYKGDYPSFRSSRYFSALISDGRNKAICDRLRTNRDTDIDARERRWIPIRSCFSEYISPIGPFDMPFVRYDHELDCWRNSR